MWTYLQRIQQIADQSKCQIRRRKQLILLLDFKRKKVGERLIKLYLEFKQKVSKFNNLNLNQLPTDLRHDLTKIQALQRQQLGYVFQQQQIACSFSGVFFEGYKGIIDKIAASRVRLIQQQGSVKRSQKKKKEKQSNFVYNLKSPLYCYCQKPESGVMIECENPFCQREWFHINCTELKDSKQIPKIWYCKNCCQEMKNFNPQYLTFFQRYNKDWKQQDLSQMRSEEKCQFEIELSQLLQSSAQSNSKSQYFDEQID